MTWVLVILRIGAAKPSRHPADRRCQTLSSSCGSAQPIAQDPDWNASP